MQTGISLVSGGWAGCFTVRICSAMILFGWGYGGYAAPAAPPAIRSIGIVLDPGASPVEQRVAGVIKNRILSVTPVTIEVGSARKPGADLYIHLGKVGASGALDDLARRETVRPPGKERPNPEGFARKTVQDGTARVLIAV